MTTLTLLNSAQIGPPLSPAQVVPPCERATFTFSISGPAGQTAQATIFGTTDGAYYKPLLVMQITSQSPTTVSEGLRFPPIYTQFDALLNQASPLAGNATVTMTY